MLEHRQKEQDKEYAILEEKLDAKIRDKAAKKGVDMERFYPGKHPPKKQIVSKYNKGKEGDRSYDERKEMYDVGCNVVRPKMLESVWEQKFSAWLQSDDV